MVLGKEEQMTLLANCKKCQKIGHNLDGLDNEISYRTRLGQDLPNLRSKHRKLEYELYAHSIQHDVDAVENK